MCYFVLKPRLKREHGKWVAWVACDGGVHCSYGDTPYEAWKLHRWGHDGYRTFAGC